MKQRVQRCLACGHIISERHIALYSGMVHTLWKVFKWCREKGIHEFQTKQVKHFFNLNSSARFGDWVMFGGLVYKNKKGYYGLNMQRCDEFFKGTYKIPEYVVKNPLTGGITQGRDITINEVPNLLKFLNDDGEFKTSYFENRNIKDCLGCLGQSESHFMNTKQHIKI